LIDKRRLLRTDFPVPEQLETEEFRLRMLTVNDLVKDYDAVMSSVEHLKSTFSVITEDDWPEGLTLEENLIDLGWHQREFTLGFSLAYTVMNLDESVCLGCVYFEPTSKADYDVVITMWVRESELAGRLPGPRYSGRGVARVLRQSIANPCSADSAGCRTSGWGIFSQEFAFSFFAWVA